MWLLIQFWFWYSLENKEKGVDKHTLRVVDCENKFGRATAIAVVVHAGLEIPGLKVHASKRLITVSESTIAPVGDQVILPN